MSDKPREFWLERNENRPHNLKAFQGPYSKEAGLIHVIEYSAYEKVIALQKMATEVTQKQIADLEMKLTLKGTEFGYSLDKMYENSLLDNLTDLRLKNEKLRTALKDIMDKIEEGTLCRNINNDVRSDWHLALLDLVLKLKNAQEILIATEGENQNVDQTTA